MIKFKELVHKETNTIIPYKDWLKHIEEDSTMIFAVTEESSWRYNPKNMLLSDDFCITFETIEKERLLELLRYSKEAIDYWFRDTDCSDENREENDNFKKECDYFMEKLINQ